MRVVYVTHHRLHITSSLTYHIISYISHHLLHITSSLTYHIIWILIGASGVCDTYLDLDIDIHVGIYIIYHMQAHEELRKMRAGTEAQLARNMCMMM